MTEYAATVFYVDHAAAFLYQDWVIVKSSEGGSEIPGGNRPAFCEVGMDNLSMRRRLGNYTPWSPGSGGQKSPR